MTDGDDDQTSELLLDTEAPGFDDHTDEDGETVVAFADEEDEEEPALVKGLREQIRERDRKLAQLRKTGPVVANDDPEPQVPARPKGIADFDYDEERFNAALDEHLAAKDTHAAWKSRQAERETARTRAEQDQVRRVEQQKAKLGVSDYDAQAAKVRETFTEQQLAILINGADNPAQLIYALGRSQTRLSLLAGEENLARFAVMVGKMEKDIKVTKKTAPAPETRVRGATAPVTLTGEDKAAERLFKQGQASGDMSQYFAHQRAKRKANK